MINFRRLFRKREAPVTDFSDLLDHPDLKRMTLRELADLPLPRIGAVQSHGAWSGGGAGELGGASEFSPAAHAAAEGGTPP